jgi:phosphoenolpyruvate carboxykinase (ATP)
MNLKVKKQLSEVGIIDINEIIYNPSYQLLYNEEQDIQLTGFEKVQDTEFGAVNVMTGIYTGRSPKDKYIVKDQTTKDKLWCTN